MTHHAEPWHWFSSPFVAPFFPKNMITYTPARTPHPIRSVRHKNSLYVFGFQPDFGVAAALSIPILADWRAPSGVVHEIPKADAGQRLE